MIKEVVIDNISPYKKKVVYILDGNIVGSLEYSVIIDRMELDNIEVNKDYRGNGIGTKLMAYLVSVAIDYSVVNITLEVRKSNEVARNLYKKFNFREVALRHNYYGDEDGILMEKQVM